MLKAKTMSLDLKVLFLMVHLNGNLFTKIVPALKESLEQNEFTQYPIIPARRYIRYWNEIESKKKHQKEIIIEEIKNNPNQIGMGC